MKTKTKIVGLAIGTGVLASLLVAGAGFQGQTFDTPETSAATIQRLPIDMDQELGSSDTEVRVARSSEMVIDMDQELGSSDTEVRLVGSQNMVFDAAQEGGAHILRGRWTVLRVWSPTRSRSSAAPTSSKLISPDIEDQGGAGKLFEIWKH